MSINQELGNDSGFSDDGAVVVDGGDEAAGVDFEICGSSRNIEVNDLLIEGQTKFAEGDVCAVGPGTAVVGVEGDFWGGSV